MIRSVALVPVKRWPVVVTKYAVTTRVFFHKAESILQGQYQGLLLYTELTNKQTVALMNLPN